MQQLKSTTEQILEMQMRMQEQMESMEERREQREERLERRQINMAHFYNSISLLLPFQPFSPILLGPCRVIIHHLYPGAPKSHR